MFLSTCVWPVICRSFNLINSSIVYNSLTSASSTGANTGLVRTRGTLRKTLYPPSGIHTRSRLNILYCIRVSPFSIKKQKWWGCLMSFHASDPVYRCVVIYPFQSQMCSISEAEVKASLDEAPRSMRANISFTESISCRFKTLEMMLIRWSMSSCVWPTIQNERRTSRKYPSATRLVQYAHMYLFLFSLL